MKLTVLADNNTFIDQYYLGEPAVSYYIEIDDCRILFDTGYSDAFLRNALSLGIDLGAITHVLCSRTDTMTIQADYMRFWTPLTYHM